MTKIQKMSLQIQETQDGSHTLYWIEKNEHYHSVHGSVQEAKKVYLETAFEKAVEMLASSGISPIRIFEMGFGTGLNALLSLKEAEKRRIPVEYTAIEAYPLSEEIWQRLNHPELCDAAEHFKQLHLCAFDEKPHEISPFFRLMKIKGDLRQIVLPAKRFHAIYFDAFAPSVQPELWEEAVFAKLSRAAASPCVLSSYCAQGQFRRHLKAVGFAVERLPGPAGKREITRGIKP